LQVASTAWLGPYRVLEPLGQGGMGVVYRARHSVTERAVAIKTVRVPASRWIESLRREIEALTQIRHPGIVRIVDHGVHHGRPWYAMDLLEGESLREFGARIWSPFRTVPSKQKRAHRLLSPRAGVKERHPLRPA
jgi:serine/threonine protein kinase